MHAKRLIFVLLTALLLLTTHFTPAAADGAPQTGDNRVKVYDGPGLFGYKTLATLPKGYAVVPLATYVDFTKVQFVDKTGATREGFVVSRRLVNVPAGLPALNVDQVPWQTVGILARKVYEFNNGSDNWEWHGFASVPAKGAVRILMQIDPASKGNFKFSDKLWTDEKKLWWQDRHRIEVVIGNGGYSAVFYDGSSEMAQLSTGIGGISDGIIIIALAGDRRSLSFLNKDGQVVGTVDANAAGNFPEGLPSKRKVFIEVMVEPHAMFTLKQLAWQIMPSGRGR